MWLQRAVTFIQVRKCFYLQHVAEYSDGQDKNVPCGCKGLKNVFVLTAYGWNMLETIRRLVSASCFPDCCIYSGVQYAGAGVSEVVAQKIASKWRLSISISSCGDCAMPATRKRIWRLGCLGVKNLIAMYSFRASCLLAA